jgi:hypothetical protein
MLGVDNSDTKGQYEENAIFCSQFEHTDDTELCVSNGKSDISKSGNLFLTITRNFLI